MTLPDPDALFPIRGERHTVFLRPLLARQGGRANVSVGAFSYYSDFDDATRFFGRNVRYDFGRSGARLSIGKFCALAHGATFLMADANHAVSGPSTYPFPLFGGAWEAAMPVEKMPFLVKGDIAVGHDVWFGYESLVMPGVTIGSGAVIGARAVVTADVAPYTIVAGNPARVVRRRFPDDEIERLLALAWWDWPAERIARDVPLLVAEKDLSPLSPLFAGCK
jgi:virginiamycin A acetyltransferase